MKLFLSAAALLAASSFAHAQPDNPADLIVHNGKVLTVEGRGNSGILASAELYQ